MSGKTKTAVLTGQFGRSGRAGTLLPLLRFRDRCIPGSRFPFLGHEPDLMRPDGHRYRDDLIDLRVGRTLLSCHRKTVFGSGLTPGAQRSSQCHEMFCLHIHSTRLVRHRKEFIISVHRR